MITRKTNQRLVNIKSSGVKTTLMPPDKLGKRVWDALNEWNLTSSISDESCMSLLMTKGPLPRLDKLWLSTVQIQYSTKLSAIDTYTNKHTDSLANCCIKAATKHYAGLKLHSNSAWLAASWDGLKGKHGNVGFFFERVKRGKGREWKEEKRERE